MRAGPAWLVGLLLLGALAACSQAAPPVVNAPTESTSGASATSAIEGATPAATVEGHFNPTEAVGGGSNSSTAVAADELARIFASVPQGSQLQLAASSSPPGATGPDVATVSVVAQDSGGLLQGLDASARRTLGDAFLTAAGTAWPNAAVSLLITDPARGGSSVIGSRPKGGPNTVITT